MIPIEEINELIAKYEGYINHLEAVSSVASGDYCASKIDAYQIVINDLKNLGINT